MLSADSLIALTDTIRIFPKETGFLTYPPYSTQIRHKRFFYSKRTLEEKSEAGKKAADERN